MTFYVLVPLIATLTNFFLGIGVLLSDIRNRIRRIFALFCFCVSFWNLGFALVYYLPKDYGFPGVRLLALPMFFIPPIFLHFVITYTNKKNLRNLCILGYMFSFGLLIADGFKLTHIDIEIYYWGNYPKVGFIGLLYPLEFSILIGYGIYILIRQYTSETAITIKNQIKYLFTGAILTFVSFSANFAPFIGIELYPLGYLGQIFSNFIIAYAIIKYRLPDIDVLFKKCLFCFIFSALFLVLFFLAKPSAMYIFSKQVKVNYVSFGSMLVMAFLLGYLVSERANRWMNQKLFAAGKDPAVLIEQMGNLVLSSTGLNTNRLIRNIFSELAEILQVSGGCIFLLGTGSEKYDLAYATGCSSGIDKNVSIPRDTPLIDILLVQKGPIVKEELELRASFGSPEEIEKEKLLAAAAQLDEFRIALCIPLITRGIIIGLLNLGQKKSGKLFSSEELNELTTLGNQIAIALDNARLLEESRNKAKEQEALSQIASEMMSMHNPIELERQIFTHIGNIIDYDRCLYFRWSEEANRLVLEYAENFDECAKELLKRIPLKHNKSVDDFDAEKVAKTVEDYLDEKGVKKPEEFALSTPLFMERKLYGVFCVFKRHVVYSEEQKRLLWLVVSQIVALQERMASTLAQAETVAMTRALTQIAHDMSHAFGILRGSFELLQARLNEMSETDQRVTSLINSEVKQLDMLLTELKKLTDEEKIRLRQEDVNVALNSALQLVASRLSISNIEVNQDLQAGAMFVLIPAGQLTQVFFNLLLNAIEAMPKGGVLKLTTKLKTRQEATSAANSVEEVQKGFVVPSDFLNASTGEIVEITISDTGCGIHDKNLYRIFKPGFTTKASSGLGLVEVKRIINTCGGKIEVHSQLGVGTNFVIQLPCHRHL